ncbi:Heparan-alpha-glucosaminide N-acetyltransferase [Senna tora]|uniref:Heparan-alpha-glucosaminide N-acetyltransferase n=1 Tax=Senna tora TaxID=362788 RepID=A0A834SVQ7_9FABA|nr:Heparan-alpha-glucosaminide N-acetyltransferase [Senna tora]
MGYVYLKSEGYGNTNNEKKERHNKIGQCASIPWGVIYMCISSSGIVHQYHQLHASNTLENDTSTFK